MTNTDWLLLLQQANLPAINAYEEVIDGETLVQAEFSRGLTYEEDSTFLSITNPQKLAKKLAKENAVSIINTAGLGGVNVSAINSNADRDALIKAICYQIGLCDHLGVLYGTVQGNQPNSQNNNNTNS